MPSPLARLVPTKEQSTDAAGASPSHLGCKVSEEFVLYDDVIALRERDFRPKLAAVAGNIRQQDRKALAVGTASHGVEIHVTPKLS